MLVSFYFCLFVLSLAVLNVKYHRLSSELLFNLYRGLNLKRFFKWIVNEFENDFHLLLIC